MKKGEPGYWAWRKNVGRKKAIRTPQKMWTLACEYFEETDANPFMKNEAIKSGELAGTVMQVPTIRPYSWEGFSDYLLSQGIAGDVDNYRINRDGRYSEFTGVMREIKAVMFQQKFDGAAVGAFNSNVIVRDLHLVEKKELEHKHGPSEDYLAALKIASKGKDE